jgi:hypothetical protein
MNSKLMMGIAIGQKTICAHLFGNPEPQKFCIKVDCSVKINNLQVHMAKFKFTFHRPLASILVLL